MTGGVARIGLGTAQFGLDYGITNSRGRIAEDEVGRILADAAQAGMIVIDTASLYGESEAAIGRSLAADAPLRLVTKTPKFASVAPAEAARELRSALDRSLAALRRRSIYGLLFHDPADLLGAHGDLLWREMEGAKREGLVAKIGLSVYDGAEIDAALRRYPIDLVQLPYNPLDGRLIDGGQLDRLAAAGVEVHARSLFLQGLLLQDAGAIPARFGVLADAVGELHAVAAAAGLSQLEAIFAAAFQRNAISHFICGVTSVAELHEVAAAARRVAERQAPFPFQTRYALGADILNPARWDRLR